MEKERKYFIKDTLDVRNSEVYGVSIAGKRMKSKLKSFTVDSWPLECKLNALSVIYYFIITLKRTVHDMQFTSCVGRQIIVLETWTCHFLR